MERVVRSALHAGVLDVIEDVAIFAPVARLGRLIRS
jgi:hypothetical protein